jgi:lysophospholipase L1-like esterase
MKPQSRGRRVTLPNTGLCRVSWRVLRRRAIKVGIVLPLMLLAAASPLMVNPTPNTRPDWMARHERNIRLIQKVQPDLVFIGDSITQELLAKGGYFGDVNAVWKQYFVCRRAFNLGAFGDTTANVLWRLENGEIDGIDPELVVVLIGTNDIGPVHHLSPEQTAEGIKEIASLVHAKLPAAKILIVGLLPKQFNDSSREKVNSLLGKVGWSALNASYVDISESLMADGKIDPSLFVEQNHRKPLLHPNEAGWNRMATALVPQISKLTSVGGCRQ